MNKKTELKLLRGWDTPTHFFPKGTRGTVLYFSNMLGMTVKEFIEKYKESKFMGWFEIFKSE